jgi:hypothetical protein
MQAGSSSTPGRLDGQDGEQQRLMHPRSLFECDTQHSGAQ